jgi:exopolyphosphatase/guanosine-5'-triphosphate,3'-diphosphate pyrophosphatase
MMRKTVIDIGTNTILMLIAEFDKNNSSVKTILDMQRIPRLGKGVDSNRNIQPESTQKAIEILNEYKKISNENNSVSITATATSFIRDSNNKNEFIIQIKDKTGIEIEILKGEDEAKWTFWGGVYDKIQGRTNAMITTIDIGGGSTEVTTGNLNQLPKSKSDFQSIPLAGKSIDVGSVRINEKFLSHHPPSYENIVQAEKYINENLSQIDFDISDSHLIGVAGTITTLAAIKLGLERFIAEKVDYVIISIDEIEHILRRLTPLSLEELYLMGDYMTGRADIVIPGILILKCFMRKFGFEKLVVSAKGLRYGIFLRDAVS